MVVSDKGWVRARSGHGHDAASFARRIDEGRGRLTLIANEIARAGGVILTEWSLATRKLKDTRQSPEACADVAQQLQRLGQAHSIALALPQVTLGLVNAGSRLVQAKPLPHLR